ncbi:ABC transporter ATP-binding protein [Candidatus Pacearchaeota archaeon]|nr:ABC transporter ATP-binding protein [Candidatus Pacearchaeota archaeon]
MKEKKSEKEEIVIRLKNISKIYEMGDEVKVRAVDGLSMTIKRGEFIAIMGPSGSGKSTCMNMVGSLDIPTYGTIYLDEEDISQFAESELAQMRGKKIGFIFQSFNLVPNLTTKGNVMLPMIFQGRSREEREAKAEELLTKVDLGDRMDHYPNQLSGGQRQRVAIARSLANDPEVILADEPTGNLDTNTGKMVLEFLDKLNSEGKTVIMVTHDAELARKHADVVYWLRDGKLEKVTHRKQKRKEQNKKRGK